MPSELLDLVFTLGAEIRTGKPQWQCDRKNPDGTITRHVPQRRGKLKPSNEHRHFGCTQLYVVEKSLNRHIHIVVVRLIEQREDVTVQTVECIPFDRKGRTRKGANGFNSHSAA